jgi:hypothetical protein
MKSFQYLAPIPPFEYLVPKTLPELLETIDGRGKELELVAGGTDLVIALKERIISPKVVVDLGRLRKELGGITIGKGVLSVGALATFSQIELNPLVGRYANALRQAAANVGTLQIRSIATLGGNLATASPAADSAPALIALDANVPSAVVLVSLYILPHTWLEELSYPMAAVAGLLAVSTWRSVAPEEFIQWRGRGSSKFLLAMGGVSVTLTVAGVLEVLVAYLSLDVLVFWVPIGLGLYLATKWTRRRSRDGPSTGSP